MAIAAAEYTGTVAFAVPYFLTILEAERTGCVEFKIWDQACEYFLDRFDQYDNCALLAVNALFLLHNQILIRRIAKHNGHSL